MEHGQRKTHAVRLGVAFGALAMLAASAWAQPAAPAAEKSASSAPTAAQTVQRLKAKSASGAVLEPNALGDFSRDNVYTAVTLCRIVDTRVAGGILPANTTRTYDVDGTNFTSQGGSSTGCALPFGVVSNAALVIHVISPTATGSLFAWGLGSTPVGSILNYVKLQTIATTSIVPVVPGAGADFSVRSSASTNVVIDVVGYFAAPVATTLDCTNVVSATTTVPYNNYTAVDAVCPSGYTVTGGGTFPVEGTLGRPNIWTDGSPFGNSWRTWVDNQTGSNRSIQTYARCCRVPGR